MSNDLPAGFVDVLGRAVAMDILRENDATNLAVILEIPLEHLLAWAGDGAGFVYGLQWPELVARRRATPPTAA